MAVYKGIEPLRTDRQSAMLTTTSIDQILAGLSGFEPELNESKSFVLPLHYSPTVK